MTEGFNNKYVNDKKYREWSHEIPPLRFKGDWDVTIIPPFGGAAVRFMVAWGGRNVSVYADFDGSLGAADEAYWEIYPNADSDSERFLIGETDALIDAIDMSLITPNRIDF